jgi:hypothetical protein
VRGVLSAFFEHDIPGVLGLSLMTFVLLSYINEMFSIAKAPWVALISCDRNETLVDEPNDVVHIVEELGAAAVVYISVQ